MHASADGPPDLSAKSSSSTFTYLKLLKDSGVVEVAPEILSVIPISLERSPIAAKGAGIGADASLFLAFSFRQQVRGGKERDKEKEKERERRKLRTPARSKPWNFFDAGTYALELPEDVGDEMFCVELWSSGRLGKSVLEGTLELSLDFLKTVVSGECESEKDFWVKLRSVNVAATTIADLRIAVSFGRKESTLARHIRDAIAIRLLEGERGQARTTQLFPRTLAGAMTLQARATPGKASVLEKAVAAWAGGDGGEIADVPATRSAKKSGYTDSPGKHGRSPSFSKKPSLDLGGEKAVRLKPSKKSTDGADLAKGTPTQTKKNAMTPLDTSRRKSALQHVPSLTGAIRRRSSSTSAEEFEKALAPNRLSGGEIDVNIPTTESNSNNTSGKLPTAAMSPPRGGGGGGGDVHALQLPRTSPPLSSSVEDGSPLTSPLYSPRRSSAVSPGTPRSEGLQALACDGSSPFPSRPPPPVTVPDTISEDIVKEQRNSLRGLSAERKLAARKGGIGGKAYGGYGSYGVGKTGAKASPPSSSGDEAGEKAAVFESGYGLAASSTQPGIVSSDEEEDGDAAATRSGSSKKVKAKVIKWASDLIFNESWQEAVEKMTEEGGSTTAETHELLSELSRKFVAVAKSYGSMIVRELHLPNERKTVKPIDVGGVIGGTKFVVAGVLFKVAQGSELLPWEASAKIAGHELKSLTALFNVNSIHHIRLALPMIAILDVLGHRLIALALCPIDSSTLIHGSADAGDTVRSSSEAVERLSQAAAHLNLAVHSIQGHLIPLALDCEVHAAVDQRMYAIDLSRVLPPELPDRARGGPLGHLFRLLRPEFVKGNMVPLSSDACSAFVAHEDDAVEQAEAVAQATRRLHKEVIPLAALALDQLHMARSDPDWTFYRLDHIHRVLHVVHASGVNMRFLFRVMFHARTRVSQQLLLVECCSRTVKQELRALMRKALQSAAESPGGVYDVIVTRQLVEYWNLLLSQRQQTALSTDLWNTVATSMQQYFGWLDPVKPLGGEQVREQLLQVPLGMCLVFLRVNEQLGLQWSTRVTHLIESSFHWLESQKDVDTPQIDTTLRERVAGFLRVGREQSVLSGLSGGLGGLGNSGSSGLGGGAGGGTGGGGSSSGGDQHDGPTRWTSSLPDLSGGVAGGGGGGSGGGVSGSNSSSFAPSKRMSASLSKLHAAEEEETARRAREFEEERRRLRKRLLEIEAQQQQLDHFSSAGDPATGLSPWSFWTQQAAQLFFEDDLVDVGSRVKLNNQAAMAMGSKLMGLSNDTADHSLKQHFRLLASRMFDSALITNPTSPVTLRYQARILMFQEGHRVGVDDPRVPNSMAPYFWSSTLRYIEFLYRVSLANDSTDSACLFDYAVFLASGGQSLHQCCWYLIRAVCSDHNNLAAVELLVKTLEVLGMQKESMILSVWHQGKSALQKRNE